MQHKKKIIAAVVVASLIVSKPTLAAFGADAALLIPHLTSILAAVNGTTTAVVSGFTNTASLLVRIENVLGATSSKVANQVAEANSNQVERQTDLAKTNRALEIERGTRMPLDPCANASRGMAAPSFDTINPGFRSADGSPFAPRGMAGPRLKTGSASMDRSIAIARKDEMAPPPEVQAVLAQKGACEAYASGAVRAQECKFAGTEPRLSSGLPDADIRAATLFDGAQTDANSGKVSLSFNDKQLAAAGAYVRNLSSPVQLRDLTKIEASNDEGRRYLALRDSFDSRLDLAMRPVEEWASNRTKFTGSIPIIEGMLDGSGAAARYLQRHLPEAAPDWKSKGVSMHQLEYIEAARRYDNPDWVKEIASASDELTLQREQLMISAQLASLMTKNLVETRKTNVMLGAIYQASLNKDFMPELAAQHKRATSTR